MLWNRSQNRDSPIPERDKCQSVAGYYTLAQYAAQLDEIPSMRVRVLERKREVPN